MHALDRRSRQRLVACIGTGANRRTALGTNGSKHYLSDINAGVQGRAVPLLRYCAYVGCVLVALLFAANWYWPSQSNRSAQQALAESPVEQTIRIQSERRWPDKIEFDTTQPTIIPSPTPV